MEARQTSNMASEVEDSEQGLLCSRVTEYTEAEADEGQIPSVNERLGELVQVFISL